MRDFCYYTPTKVYFGKNAEDNIGAELLRLGATRVLLVFGGASARKSGVLGRVEKHLDEAGLSYVELGGVEPNPKIGFVRSGVELAKRENVDFILAVGGGSALDTSKAIAHGMSYDGDPWELFMTGKTPEKRVPIGSVITIAAAGSEMSDSCVITNPETHMKRSLNTNMNRPEVAFMNPENTYTVPPYQTACGIVDIMMHTFERYFTDSPVTEPTDSIAESIIATVRDAGLAALKDPNDYEARASLMWCSSISHNGLTCCGRSFWFVCHKLEHDISGLFDHISHGAGLAVVFPAWAKFVYKNDVPRFARFAEKIWGITDGTPEERALAGIEALKNYFRKIGMPVTMAELGVTPDWYERIADLTTDGGTKLVGSYIPLDKAMIMEIYKLAE